MDASLAERIRAIAANPTPAALAELPAISVWVDRMERVLDEIAADALESAAMDVGQHLVQARARRAVRRRRRIKVVT